MKTLKMMLKALLRPLVRPMLEKFRLTIMNGRGGNVVSPFQIDPELLKTYNEDCNKNQAKEIFKNNVEYIYLETHSFCNRKCWFCPNSFIDRTHMTHIDETVFTKTLSELSEIDFDGDIGLSNYNEPLSDPHFAKNRILKVRQALPAAKIMINSNGDYIDRKRLIELSDNGLDRIIITIYEGNDNPDMQFCRDSMLNSIVKKGEKLGLSLNVHDMPMPDDMIAATDWVNNLNVIIIALNYRNIAYDRGQSLPIHLPHRKQESRNMLCSAPFTTLPIHYNGLVMPCANMRPDIDKHKQFIIGDLNKESIFSVFCGNKSVEFRKRLISDMNAWPCATCIVDCQYSILNPPNETPRGRPRDRHRSM